MCRPRWLSASAASHRDSYYVFCGERFLVAYLRPSNIDPALHSRAILRLLANRLRQKGPNTRFVVTNLNATPKQICDGLYIQRGEMENRIKEQQLGLFADRTSSHKFIMIAFL